MGVLRQACLPKTLEMKIVGESLFNGIGVVIVLVLLNLLPREAAPAANIVWLVMEEVVGEAAWAGPGLCRSPDASLRGQLPGGDSHYLGVDRGRFRVGRATAYIRSDRGGRRGADRELQAAADHVETTRERPDSFWELLEEVLNAILFMLISLEVLALSVHLSYLMPGLVAVPLVGVVCWITVMAQVGGVCLAREFGDKTVRILIGGGLHGGISVALAFS